MRAAARGQRRAGGRKLRAFGNLLRLEADTGVNAAEDLDAFEIRSGADPSHRLHV